MLLAVTLDFWNTLFVDRGGREREHRRAACIAAELGAAGLHPAPAAIEEALADGYSYFEDVWRREARTPDAAETVQVILSRLHAPMAGDVAGRIVKTFEHLLLEVPPDPVPSAQRVVCELATVYRLGIISDTGYSPGWVLRELLDRHGMLSPLSYLYFSNEQDASKPDPRAFRRTLAELGIRAAEAAHVGDMQRTDIAGAKAVGMWTVHFVGANNADATVSTADVLIRHFDELPAALGSLSCAGC
jgi:HAD superfamily hydrolase (TIGR01549 family)